ncbi:MAG: TrkA C-terminal domain-containing protein [Xanthomonadales bacterium]|nr:TrkA C-terminal domain-containing protein [Xanthomonadales bacterium]
MAGAIVDYIAAHVDFPEIDIRQRLSSSKAYGVSEIYVREGSEFVGQTIADSGLREQDINVLTLYRDSKAIQNPRPSRELQADDRLLCFGKIESMRRLVPAVVRKKRRPKLQNLPE